jgi:hypothetical protein
MYWSIGGLLSFIKTKQIESGGKNGHLSRD